jgi:dUTP pyrophosphatase
MNEMRRITPVLKIAKLHPEARLPKRWSNGAIGYDLHALLLTEYGRPSKRVIPPNSTVNIPTGISIEAPKDCFVFVCPRSGLGKHSISITNSPGLIDPDYRGEVQILVYNGSYQNFWIEHDMRIAQLVIMPITPVNVVEVKQLSNTERGVAGFGSTGYAP